MTKDAFAILLVEDNPAHAELVLRSFEQYNAASHIYHVSDGEAALDYVFARGNYADARTFPRPDVILLDLHLPKVNGLRVLQEVKESPNLRSIPVVVLTTSEAEKDLESAYYCHANSYLVKPVDFNKFTALMQELDLYWLGWNRCPDDMPADDAPAAPT
ncbi:MAG: response regulator [Anaerolineae bacterium]|nr:response regulator [Anaerolineae bacterium]